MTKLYTLYASITFCILFFVFFPFILLFGICKQKKILWHITRVWSSIWLFFLAMPTRIIYDYPYTDTNKGYIVVANHQSYLDTPLIFKAIPFMVSPLAKFELSKIPLFGYLYKQMTVLVDRSSTESKVQSMKTLRSIIENGQSIFIFPEGTFNETSEPMLPFYDGAFKIAIQTQTPILPMLFPDTAKRFHYSSFWKWSPGVNRVIYLEPILTEGLTVKDIASLKAKTRQLMSEKMQEYRN